MSKTEKQLSFISGLLVLIIATAAFWLSFNAIRELAIQNGTNPNLAWLVPVVVDLAMIAFKVSVLRATIQGESSYFGWFLIVLFVALSVWFNVEHSQKTILSGSLAALAPLALFASFQVFISQVHSTVRHSLVIQAIDDLKTEQANLKKQNKQLRQNGESLNSQNEEIKQAIEQKTQQAQEEIKQEIAGLIEQKGELTEQIRQLSEQKESGQLDETDRMLLQFVKVNPSATYREIGEFIERAPGTVGNYVRRLTEQGLLHKNGEGYEVNHA